MFTGLTVAAALVTLAVPYLPQTDALCGGAAAAMVFRYWGEAHADMRDFAALVDRRAGGIADDVLVAAIRQRGWQATQVVGSPGRLSEEVASGHPVIVLVADGRATYHYEVVTGVGDGVIVVHDPTWGPSREIAIERFVRAWRTTNFWTLVVVPRPGRDALQGLSDNSGVGHGGQTVPTQTGPDPVPGSLAERAGISFADRRWVDAERLAEGATRENRADTYAWDVLGSSRFMQDDPAGALRAWNRIGKPHVNALAIDGLKRTRYQTVAEWTRIQPNALLSADDFELAARRVEELPDRSGSRLSYRPGVDGYADVQVAFAERPRLPRSWPGWGVEAAHALTDRELRVEIPATEGQGAIWSASWRWWANRPAVSVAFAAPRTGWWPGVWRVSGDWDAETYTAAGERTREVHVGARAEVSDWLTARLRYSVAGGIDEWSTGPSRTRAPFVEVGAERRMFDDRWQLAASATAWTTHDRIAFSTRFRTSAGAEGWVQSAEAGLERTTDAAPRAAWPAAGEGYARLPLLRAHPLLDGGIIDVARTMFGRSLLHANVESIRWLSSPPLARLGIAAFSDAAESWRRASSSSLAHVDVGGGLRVRVPGSEGTFRIDVAHGLDDGANALTVGWTIR